MKTRDGLAYLKGASVGAVLTIFGVVAAAADPAPVAIVRAIVSDLAAGRFSAVEARMDTAMRAALPETKLGGLWRALVVEFGAFEHPGATTTPNSRPGAILTITPLVFAKRTIDLKLAIADGKLVGLFYAPHTASVDEWRPPAYAEGAAFHAVDITLGTAPRALPGTLTLPANVARAPIAILLHGSGPQDRDESVGPNRPFRDIAMGLAAKGIATLRFDKRTKVYPHDFADRPHATVKQEALDDAALAVAFAEARPDIDPRRIVIVGHSLGATLAPRAAEADPGVAAIAMLAPAARRLPLMVVAQTEYLLALKGAPTAQQEAYLADLKAGAARAAAAKPGDTGAPFMGVPLAYWADLNAYDPVASAARLAIPMLVMQGGRDYQVTREDYDRYAAALAHKTSARLVLAPALNHLFMPGTGPSTPEEYEVPGHVDASVIEALAAFIHSLR